MTLILKLLQINYIFGTSLAIGGNVLLIYLILSVNKNNIKKMNIILLPNCIIDLLSAIVTLIAQPLFLVIGNQVFIVMGSGFTSNIFNVASIELWFFGSLLAVSMNSVCIPFYLRFLVICKNIKVQAKHVIIPYLILLITFLIIFPLFIWCYPINFENYSKNKEIFNNEFWLDEFKNGVSFAAVEIGDIPFFAVIGTFGVTTGLSYTLVVYFSIAIAGTLRTHVSNYSSTKILSKQLNKTLTIQAIGPFLIGNIPVFSLTAIFCFNIESIKIPLFFSFFLGWITVVNPIAAILIIAPYRQKVKSFIWLNKFSTVSNGITQHNRINNINNSTTKIDSSKANIQSINFSNLHLQINTVA